MDARERIRRARQEAELSENIDTLVESAIERQQEVVLQWITRSLAPVLGNVKRELHGLETAQKQAASTLRIEIDSTRSEIARNRKEIQQERWIAATFCVLVALVAGAIGLRLAPIFTTESQRLRDQGLRVEQRYREMTDKERAQMRKLMDWEERTERRTR